MKEYDQYDCLDDVSDDDIIDCCPFFSVTEVYTYDSRTNKEEKYNMP